MGAWLSWMIFRCFKDLLSFLEQKLGPQTYPSPASSHDESDVVPVLMWGDAGRGAAGLMSSLLEVFVSYESISHPSFLFNASWQRMSALV